MNDQTAEQMMLACEARGVDRNSYGNDLPIMAAAELRQNIWAVRWLYHHLLRGGLCLRPPWSLVEHIGFDALATNASSASAWANPPLRACPPVPRTWPDALEHAASGALQRRAFPPPPVRPPSLLSGLARRITRRLRRVTLALTGSKRLEPLSLRRAVAGLDTAGPAAGLSGGPGPDGRPRHRRGCPIRRAPTHGSVCYLVRRPSR